MSINPECILVCFKNTDQILIKCFEQQQPKKLLTVFLVLTSFQAIYSPWQNSGGSSTLWWLANVLNIHPNLFLNPDENENNCNFEKGTKCRRAN